MLFNSNFFVYVFLPILFLAYYFAVRWAKHSVKASNIVLLLFSLLFYLCTGGKSIFILVGVILLNYVFAIAMDRVKKYRKILLIAGVMTNVGVLLFFKYSYFLYTNLVKPFPFFSEATASRIYEIVLPVGISFFLFQAISYLVDVYREEVPTQYNLGKFALYISLFPQLVAGPIVRYKTVCNEIEMRKVDTTNVYEGTCRFIFGLGKKVLIADMLGSVVDSIWGLPKDNITLALAWSAAFLYTLQIYFDFSGYSDMAIGLGRILGFHFLENFELPYTSHNLTEFWRKWHISLSSFLRDYLYIPLGGNRKGTIYTYRNLFIVFFVCGLWHGADWNFIFWGVYHGVFLIIERILKNKCNFSMKGIPGQIISFFVVMLGWVLFRANSVTEAFSFLRVMFGGQIQSATMFFEFGYYIYPKIIIIALGAFIASFFKFEKLRKYINEHDLKGILAIVVLVISMLYMSDASFTPFIYFQF